MNWWLVCALLIIATINGTAQSPLEDALNRIDGIDSIRQNPKFQFECILTRIERTPSDIKFYTYHVGDSSSYYYPASSVKLPLALQILHNYELSDSFKLEDCTVCGSYQYDADYHVGSLLKKMLVFSDNPSYNYLFELSGAGGMQAYMTKYNIPGQVNRRLLTCPKKNWRKSNQTTLTALDIQSKFRGSFKHGLNAKVGRAHYYGNQFHSKPRNFKKHNYLPLKTDHDILKKLLFDHESLGISVSEKDTLIHYLSMTPLEYGDSTKEDGFTKYLWMGKDSTSIPENIQITNIVGRAYGFMIDHAYILDKNTNSEFILSVKIYLNRNSILGDDLYEYESIGYPLFKALGIEILKE